MRVLRGVVYMTNSRQSLGGHRRRQCARRTGRFHTLHVCPPFRLSVCPIAAAFRSISATAQRAGDIDRLLQQATAHSSTIMIIIIIIVVA